MRGFSSLLVAYLRGRFGRSNLICCIIDLRVNSLSYPPLCSASLGSLAPGDARFPFYLPSVSEFENIRFRIVVLAKFCC
jgi:hypothetical protein